jgi:hypothetical protein
MLQVWLTAPLVKRITERYGIVKPVIWMLTGYYELKGTRCYEMKSSKPGILAGIASSTLAALTGVPVGGSIDLGSGTSMVEQGVGLDEPHIWAAQYRRLDVKYIMARSGQTEPHLPTSFGLLANVSDGALRGYDGSEIKSAQLALHNHHDLSGKSTSSQATGVEDRVEVEQIEEENQVDYDKALDSEIEDLLNFYRPNQEDSKQEEVDEPREDEL